MHAIYIELVLSGIFEKYTSESAFYREYLGLSEEKWLQWKKGVLSLSPEENQKIKNIFSDYEWMLLQKILRQTIIYPEKRQIAVSEYKKLKIKIAQKWLNTNCGVVEFQQLKEEEKKEHFIDLRVSLQYDEWGFDDVLNFRLPAAIQQQVVSQKVALLDWVNEELESAYVQ
ncbi:hypothetical protein ACYSNO_02195 [Enterococcus sp. LJL98]